MSTKTRVPRLAALVAAVVLAAPLTPADPLARYDSAGELVEVLRRKPGDGRTEDDVVAELAEVGTRGIPVLFAIATGELDGLISAEQATELWGGPDMLDALVMGALGRLPAEDVLAHLRSRTRPGSEGEVRLGAVRVLGELRSAEGLDLLMELVAGFDPILLRAQRARGPIEQSASSILRHDSSSWAWATREVEKLEGAQLDFLVRGIELAERPEAVEVLVSMVGRDPDLDERVIELAADITYTKPWLVGRDPLAELRSLLGSDSWQVRRSSAVALGRVHDVEAFPGIVELLGDEEPRVRSAARWALEAMAGESRSRSEEEWRAWHEEELSWHDRAWEPLRENLYSSEARTVIDAVAALARRPFWRHEAARVLTDTLGRRGEAVDTTICIALREVDSRHALPALVDMLQSGDAAVQQAAWETLKRLTGEDLPNDPADWRELVRE